MRYWKVLLVVFSVLALDQGIKFWVKLNMTVNEVIPILGEWFVFRFIENPGMAFGIELPGIWGKLALSVFRLFAIGFIIYYIHILTKKKAHWGLVFCISLILAGAIGNMIDSAFYGMIFSSSGYHLQAELFPPDGGYGKFLQGNVVDMCQLNLVDTELPKWVWFAEEGERFRFFEPIFNVADSAISIGVFLIIIFQRPFFKGLDDKMNGKKYTVQEGAEEVVSYLQKKGLSMDYSMESLHTLDDYMANWTSNEPDVSIDNILPGLGSYVGEVMVKIDPSIHWQADDDGRSYIPDAVIKGPEQMTLYPVEYVVSNYKESNTIALHSFASMNLRKLDSSQNSSEENSSV